MWRKIRGAGLAYGYFIEAVVSEGMLSFCLFKSSHPVNAFKAAKDIIVSEEFLQRRYFLHSLR